MLQHVQQDVLSMHFGFAVLDVLIYMSEIDQKMLYDIKFKPCFRVDIYPRLPVSHNVQRMVRLSFLDMEETLFCGSSRG